MKIEIGESLCYSYLRHVKQCWLVQTNWKASEHWDKLSTDDELEGLFRSMRQTFDLGGSVFKGTKDSSQFLKQGEIDVVGVGQDGCIHAMEMAFHEAGLNYVGGVGNRVLKKLLRIMLILDTYHPAGTERNIYMVSPKVHRGVQQPLEDIFNRLRSEYPSINWHLLTNDEFSSQLLAPTLEKAKSVADTTELFVRSVKLLELGGLSVSSNGDSRPPRAADAITALGTREPTASVEVEVWENETKEELEKKSGQLQPIVQDLMKTLLEDFPGLLTEYDLENVLKKDYCKDTLGLQLGGFALLRLREDGREISGHPRYWLKVYAGRYYVTNNWWAAHHVHNAESLLRWVERLINHRAGHAGVALLERHRATLQSYI